MKKIAFIFIFFYGSSIISCIEEKCPYIEPYFQIESIETSILEFTNEGINPWSTINENDTIQWENFFVRVYFNSNYIAENCTNNYFGDKLLALSCHELGYKGSKIGVNNIHIKTINDYNTIYSKNDTIDSIIGLNYWTYNINEFDSFITIDEYIEQNDSSIMTQYFEVKLNSPPDDDYKISQFLIIYELDNGDKFETITDNIVLRN